MPAETVRLFVLATCSTLAVGLLQEEHKACAPFLLLLALAALGVRWARVMFAISAGFWTLMAGIGWVYLLYHGGDVSAADARGLAWMTMCAVALVCITSPAVKSWASAQTSPAESCSISQSAPG